MPRKLELSNLNLDISSVKQLINQAEKYGDFVAKKQYINKLNRLLLQVEELETEHVTNASVALFFDGEPVYGSKGINATFAGNSLGSFQELVNKMFAYKEHGGLCSNGAIACKGSSNLMITSVVKGSFGFVLDELSDQIELTETSLKVTLDDVIDLIEATSAEEESRFNEAIEFIDDRILRSLKKFFTTLDKGKSCLRIVGDHHEYKLTGGSIRLARERTEATTIEEEASVQVITLVGLLPESCKFEALSINNDLFSGTMAKSVATRLHGQKLDTKIKVKLSTKVIKPFHKPEKRIYRIEELID